MRTITAAQQAVLDAEGRAEHVRVLIKDSGGTYRDLTTYPGFNAVVSCRWGETLDDDVPTASVTLWREVDRLSLAPLMLDSALNVGYVPGGTYAALIAPGRMIRIDVAVVAMDTAPASADWMTVFEGYVDSVDPGGPDQEQLECSGLIARIRNTYIRWERVYSFGEVGGAAVGMRIWSPSTVWVLNEYVLPTEANRNGHFFKVTTAGTGGATEPVWPTSGTVAGGGTTVFTRQASTSTAGFPVEETMQALLDDNLGGGVVTLQVPSSSGWGLSPYIQSRSTLLDALQTLATQRGWHVRYVWDSGSSTFLLTFYEPDRAKVAADYTFGPSDGNVGAMPLSMLDVRNTVRVTYADAADLDPGGTGKRKYVEATDSASITAFGDLFCEICEDDASQIDTSAEAQDMADAAVADMATPVTGHTFEACLGFPWAEIGDLLEFEADDRHYSGDQALALVSYQHTAEAGVIKTTLQTSGKPSLGVDRWKRVIAHPSGRPVHQVSVFEAPSGVSVTVVPIVGGGRIQLASELDKDAFGPEYEHHISASAAFTPSDSTLVSVGSEREVEIANLIPGATYYYAVVPRTRNGNRVLRAQKSAETSFVAGRASAGHATAEVDWGSRPLNAGFETYFAGTGLPDHWAGDAVTVKTDGNGLSGGKYIRLTAAAGAKAVYSGWMTAKANTYYRLDASIQGSAGADSFTVDWQGADYAQAPDVGTTAVLSFNSGNYVTWTKLNGFFLTGSGTRFLRVVITAAAGGSNYVDFDELRLEEVKPSTHWQFSGDTLQVGTTTEYAFPGVYFGSGGLNAAEIKARTPIPGVLSRMWIFVRGSSTGVSYTVTLRVNASDTALTAVLTAGTTSVSDLTHAVVIAEADALSVKVVSANTGGGPVAADDILIAFRHDY